MPRAITYDQKLGEPVAMLSEEKMELASLLVEDTSVLTNICERILGGACEQELPVGTVERLHSTLNAISSMTTREQQDAGLMVALAKGVESALSKICSLRSLVLQTGDETRLSCMHPMLAFGATLNSLYREMGCAIGVCLQRKNS